MAGASIGQGMTRIGTETPSLRNTDFVCLLGAHKASMSLARATQGDSSQSKSGQRSVSQKVRPTFAALGKRRK